jgi:hypothetical protein
MVFNRPLAIASISNGLLLDCMEGLPKQLHGFGMFEEVLTMVGGDG